MKVKCRYCGAMISDTCETCPICGAPNEDMIRGSSDSPRTLEQLIKFCNMRNMPLNQMRFALGCNMEEPRWFGIYKEGTNFVVYKNKSDGTRVIRYEGPDEAYAVAQIYDKIKSEHMLRKEQEYNRHLDRLNRQSYNSNGYGMGGPGPTKKKHRYFAYKLIAIICAVMVVNTFLLPSVFFLKAYQRWSSERDTTSGYYHRGTDYYYCDSDDWYLYDNGDWSYIGSQFNLDEDYKMEKWQATEYFGDNLYPDDIYTYHSSSSSDSDWNSGWNDSYDWDSGSSWDSWDSSDTDWDSDW